MLGLPLSPFLMRSAIRLADAGIALLAVLALLSIGVFLLITVTGRIL